MDMESAQPIREERHGLAVAALVLGVLSLLVFCIPWIALPAAVAAIVLGVVVRRRGPELIGSENVTMATVGVVCGSVAVTLIALILLVAATGQFLMERDPKPHIIGPPPREQPIPYQPHAPEGIAPPADDPAHHIHTPRERARRQTA